MAPQRPHAGASSAVTITRMRPSRKPKPASPTPAVAAAAGPSSTKVAKKPASRCAQDMSLAPPVAMPVTVVSNLPSFSSVNVTLLPRAGKVKGKRAPKVPFVPLRPSNLDTALASPAKRVSLSREVAATSLPAPVVDVTGLGAVSGVMEVVKPAVVEVVKPAVVAAVKPAVKPAAKRSGKPAASKVTQSLANKVTKPAARKAAKAVVEPTIQPSKPATKAVEPTPSSFKMTTRQSTRAAAARNTPATKERVRIQLNHPRLDYDLLLAKIMHACHEYVAPEIMATVNRHQPHAKQTAWITERTQVDTDQGRKKRYLVLDERTWKLKQYSTAWEAKAAGTKVPSLDAGNGVHIFYKENTKYTDFIKGFKSEARVAQKKFAQSALPPSCGPAFADKCLQQDMLQIREKAGVDDKTQDGSPVFLHVCSALERIKAGEL